MARYIDAEKLKMDSDIDNFDMPYGCSFKVIDRQPTADVVEVKHGEWKGEAVTCSVCGRNISEIYDADSYMSYGIEDELKWCPFCGAKMDGGVNDG